MTAKKTRKAAKITILPYAEIDKLSKYEFEKYLDGLSGESKETREQVLLSRLSSLREKFGPALTEASSLAQRHNLPWTFELQIDGDDYSVEYRTLVKSEIWNSSDCYDGDPDWDSSSC